MNTDLQERIFNEWISLKSDVQQLAGIVQNSGMRLTDKEITDWKEKADKFRNKVGLLSKATEMFMRETFVEQDDIPF